MKIADDISIRIGGEAIELRPSLRFALQLERRPGGFPKLTKDVIDGSLIAAADVIRPHYSDPNLEARIIDQIVAGTLTGTLIDYIMACSGIDPDNAANDNDKPQTAKPVTFRAFLEDLYRKATGWLGWTPDTALDATPAQIVAAMEGRMEMLKAIFGGGEDAQTAKPDKPAGDWGQSFAFFARARSQAAGGA